MKYFFRLIHLILSLLFLFLSPDGISAIAPIDFAPRKGDHIVILGNTFADRMRYYGYFETLLQKIFPDKQLTVRNMGWSADEVALQPRPFNFAGFRQDTAEQITDHRDVRFEGWSSEKVTMPVALNLAGLHQDLIEQKADIILLCFGMNESFKGEVGLPQYKKDLAAFIKKLQEQKYNGRSAPQLILVSPIAHEDLGGYLPKADTHNRSLAIYTEAMQQIAEEHRILFLNLLNPSLARMEANPIEPITINGIHLSDQGYLEASMWMAEQLGLGAQAASLNMASENAVKLREVIKMKDQHFFYRWRAVNGEYIYGRRREPFGVISYPPEMRKLNQIVTELDTVIWQLSRNSGTEGYEKALAIVREQTNPGTITTSTKIIMKGKQGVQHVLREGLHEDVKLQPAVTEQFSVPEGYEVNLFASEIDSPIEKPVSMAFDAQGRLWVASMPTYPQYYPGIPVHDKIVILEDTSGDGRADKHTIFADKLYLPLGFEFGDGGIYVSQQPDLLFLKDTTGDDKADIREVVLMGFGSEDSHHAIHTFTYGQDGALYFNEGTFLNSQVETPYGPVRSYRGSTYRFEPRTGKLSSYISYGYDNPWGNVFDRWGMHLIADASNGSNYYATPMTGKIDYPDKHTPINSFTTTRVRPTAGIEIISSRHFPEEVQGNLLINNTIGFQGIKQHQIMVQGSGITSKEVEPLLQSSDPNFRPVDLQFGPDGALYVVDWFNPLISHGENPPRDPGRDKSHGRIWRITYKHKPLLKTVDISTQSIPQLLDRLKGYEDHLRYRSRAQIREQTPEKVLPELQKWVSKLDANDPEYEHHMLEALWLYQDFDVVEEDILKRLLNAKDYRARAAATRVLLYWRDRVSDPLDLFQARIHDESPRVRLEAIVALSYFDSEKAVTTALEVLKYPRDYYLDYATNETLGYLEPVWMASFTHNERFLADDPTAAAYLLGRTSTEALLQLPRSKHVLHALLTKPDVKAENRIETLHLLAKQREMSPVVLIIETIRSINELPEMSQEEIYAGTHDLTRILLSWDRGELQENEKQLRSFLDTNQQPSVQAVGYAALITAEGSDKPVWKTASQDVQSLTSYLTGISLLNDSVLQSSFYEKVKKLTREVPKKLEKRYRETEQISADSTFYPVFAAAYRVLFDIPGHDQEKIQLITDMIKPVGPYLDVAIHIIAAKKDQEINKAYIAPILEKIMSLANKTPEDQRNSISFENAITLGKRLARLLPQQDADKILSVLERKGTMEIKISAVPSKMAFDREVITIPAGRFVSLVFDNADGMPHNVVIVKPGSAEQVGKAADAMAALKDGFEKNFVPTMPQVLFATPLVNGGESFRLDFKAPDVPGEYPFICSFPGHWRMMKGIIKIVKPADIEEN